MYKAIGMNEFGQIYSHNGILEQYKKELNTSVGEFKSLGEAKQYAEKFITTYPQVKFKIFKNNEYLCEIRDEEYWQWKENNIQEWKELNKKGENIQKVIFFSFLGLIGLLIAVISHFTEGLPFYIKAVAFPLFIIGGWYILNIVFSRLC